MAASAIRLSGLLECVGCREELVVGKLWCPACERINAELDARFAERKAEQQRRDQADWERAVMRLAVKPAPGAGGQLEAEAARSGAWVGSVLVLVACALVGGAAAILLTMHVFVGGFVAFWIVAACVLLYRVLMFWQRKGGVR